MQDNQNDYTCNREFSLNNSHLNNPTSTPGSSTHNSLPSKANNISTIEFQIHISENDTQLNDILERYSSSDEDNMSTDNNTKKTMQRVNLDKLTRWTHVHELVECIPPLAVLFLVFAFQNPIADIFDKTLLPLLNNVEPNAITNGFFVAIIVCCLSWIVWACMNKYHIPEKIWIPVLAAEIFYFYMQHEHHYESYPDLRGLGYADGLVVMAGLMFIIPAFWSNINATWYDARKKNSKKTSETKSESNGNFLTILDKPVINPNEDELEYDTFAMTMANEIVKNDCIDSYSIGIKGQWGSGKSSFLNLLKFHIEENLVTKNKKFLILEFNPSNSKTTELIQEDFFSLLYSKLAPYDFRFSSVIRDYLEAINIIDAQPAIKILSKTHNLWDGHDKKGLIEESLKRRWHKVIVFIEDFDRMLRPEIIEVFKLINGTANFKNFVFITAFDKTRVDFLLSDLADNNKSKSQTECYADKFFNYEINLPIRPYQMILDYIKKSLNTTIFNNTDIDISHLLTERESELKQCIPTLRDAKRFINQFCLCYHNVDGEVDVEDYLLLSLIKYRYPEEYQKLASLQDAMDLLVIPSQIGDEYKLKEEYTKFNSSKILEDLFLKENPTFRSIRMTDAFQIYFHEHVYGHFSIKEMSVILNPDGAWIKFLSQVQDRTQASDVYNFLLSKNPWELGSKELFEHYLKALILFSCNNLYSLTCKILSFFYFDNLKKAKDKYGYNEVEYKNMLLTQLEGTDSYIPNGLIRDLLAYDIETDPSKPNASIIKHNDILQVAIKNFERILQVEDNSGPKVYDTFFSCIDKIETGTRKTILNPKACKLMRERIEKSPDAYFSSFVRLLLFSSNPEYNSITCEPFWEQIFENESNVRVIINNPTIAISKRPIVKNFWKLYKANGFQPISFEDDGDVQGKIDAGLMDEVSRFDEAMAIEGNFHTLKSKYYADEIDSQNYKKELENLKGQIDKINLNIRKINFLRVEMVNEQEQLQN